MSGVALDIHIDGASRGNPGDAGFGVHVTGRDGSELAGLYGFLGKATNNVAEYQALIAPKQQPRRRPDGQRGGRGGYGGGRGGHGQRPRQRRDRY